MASAQHAFASQAKESNVTTLRRSPLTPGLASAAKRFGIRPDAVQRHEQYEKDRRRELQLAQVQRDTAKAKYEALKGTVDQLVERIQDVASAPAKAASGDISNIRTLLKQAYKAMERQQVELKGIRARTQRIERATLKADSVQKEVETLRDDITGFQRSLHLVRKDMALLVDVVEGEGGLKDLQTELRNVKEDVEATKSRTDKLETSLQDQQSRTDAIEQQAHTTSFKVSTLEGQAKEQSIRTQKLEKDMETLRTLLDSNMNETAGVATSMLKLREEVNQMGGRFAKYVVDQMRAVRVNVSKQEAK